MDFTRGGGIGEVQIREWDGTTYVLDETLLGEGCNAADTACAFNNGATIDGGPWVNLDKTGNEVTELLPNAFTEFGINYTDLVGGTPCISSVMGKTRSSQSFTAELKDFALTNFSICSLAWEKRNGATGALQTGATFSVTPNPATGTGSLTGITDCTAAPCSGSDKDPDAGQYLLTGVLTGTYTITETAAPAGFAIDPDPTRVQTVGTGNLNAVVGVQGVDDKAGTTLCDGSSDECDFHNSRAVLKITGFSYTNAPTATGTLTSGVVSGTVVYTAAIHNYGGGSATLSNSSLVVSNNASCTGGNTLAISGTVAAGANLTPAPTLTCTYSDLADGAVVTATLTVKYGGGSLEASGSPATISFTVQSD